VSATEIQKRTLSPEHRPARAVAQQRRRERERLAPCVVRESGIRVDLADPSPDTITLDDLIVERGGPRALERATHQPLLLLHDLIDVHVFLSS
jgi:hypothetical protein